MPPGDIAKHNHDQLFSDGASALSRTDPELIAYFDDFAFDETLADAAGLDDTIDLRLRLIAQLGAVLAGGGVAEFRTLAAAALRTGTLTPVELKEVVYQAVAYVGMARTYDYLHTTNELLTETGVELPLPGQTTTDPGTRFERGLAVQKQIFGSEQVDAMHADAPDDEMHVQRYLSANCFGDTVGREGLDLRERELLTFAMLTGLGGADNQIKGHVTGNLNVGNTRARLLAVLTVLIPFVGYPRALNALAALDAVTLS